MARKKLYDPPTPPRVTCPSCQGTGARPGALAELAAGRATSIHRDHTIDLSGCVCLTCHGEGKIVDDPTVTHVDITSSFQD